MQVKLSLKSVSIDQGQRMERGSPCCILSFCHFWRVWFLTTGPMVIIVVIYAEFFRVKELAVYLWEAWLSRINPSPWHTLLPLLLSAPRRWLRQPSSNFWRLLRYPIRKNWCLSCWPYAYLLRSQPQTLFPPVLLWMRLVNSTHR